MTEYVKHEFDGRVREVAARWTNPSGVKYLWLISTDGMDPSSFFDDHWEEHDPIPKFPRTGERWFTSRGELVSIVGHNDLPDVGWIFAYQFDRSTDSGRNGYTHVRNVDEQINKGWKRASIS